MIVVVGNWHSYNYKEWDVAQGKAFFGFWRKLNILVSFALFLGGCLDF
jgi:hypothetical protein